MALKVLLLVLMVTINRGESLKCYECTTPVEPNSACVDLSKGKETITTEECSNNEVCSIFTSKNPITGGSTVTRGCNPKEICDTLHAKETNYNKIVDCHTCDSDLCSSGNLVEVSVSAPFISLLLVTLARQFLH